MTNKILTIDLEWGYAEGAVRRKVYTRGVVDEGIISEERKETLLRFLATLAWADGVVEQEEIDFLLKKRKSLKLPQNLDKELQKLLVTYHEPAQIAEVYEKARSLFTGSRNLPNPILDGGSAYIPPEEVDSLFVSAMFEVLASDGKISEQEGRMLELLQSGYKEVKNIIYGRFPGSEAI